MAISINRYAKEHKLNGQALYTRSVSDPNFPKFKYRDGNTKMYTPQSLNKYLLEHPLRTYKKKEELPQVENVNAAPDATSEVTTNCDACKLSLEALSDRLDNRMDIIVENFTLLADQVKALQTMMVSHHTFNMALDDKLMKLTKMVKEIHKGLIGEEKKDEPNQNA